MTWSSRLARIILQGAAAALALAIAPAPAAATEKFVGVPRIVDGDTLAFDGQRVRIRGIDAPETSQTCSRRGVDEPCGVLSTQALAGKIGSGTVVCLSEERDDHNRPIAVCRLGTLDLGAWMVETGHAVAFVRYVRDYVPLETAARRQGLGIWGTSFEMPWDYRHRTSPASTGPASSPSTCRIKGNINSAGNRIYHVPGQARYETTTINQQAGERWFCTTAEAEAAGWRPSKR